MNRRAWALLIGGWLVTRVLLVALTATPLNISASREDLALYSGWAQAILDHGAMPYSDVAIEYPPGSLPFAIAAEAMAAGISYRTAFVAIMMALDIAAFVALLRLARRSGSFTGPWVWVLAVFLLGPIVYLRLDLIPAVATIWAIERAAANAWASSGALFAFGAAAKLYPILLMPAALWHAARRRFLVGAGIVGAVALLPFVAVLPDLYDGVIGYHAGRGIQLESSWGAGLILAARRGYDAFLELSFGALHFRSPISSQLEVAAAILSLLVVAGATTLIVKRVPRGDIGRLAVGLYGLLALVMFTGTVLSPQFITWLIALAAAALCFQIPEVRRPLLLIVPIAALTQLEFPYNYESLKFGEYGPLMILTARNLLILGSGLTALLLATRRRDERSH